MATRTPVTNKPAPPRTRILDAAIRCIEKLGVTNMTMEDVAAEAGVVRKTVYLAYGNRKALLNAVLMSKVGINVAQMRRYVDGFDALGEALVKGCVRHVNLIRKDPLFFALLRSLQDAEFERFILSPRSPTLEMTLDIWGGALQRARERGELRPDLTDVEIANWLLGVMSFLLARDDLTARAKGDLLKKFLLPAFLRQ